MDYLGDYSRSPAAVKRRGNDSQAGRFERNVPVRAAEQQRSALQAELTQVTGHPQPATVQLTPAALERHL